MITCILSWLIYVFNAFLVSEKLFTDVDRLNDIKIIRFIFGIYAEIFESDFQGFTEIFGPPS